MTSFSARTLPPSTGPSDAVLRAGLFVILAFVCQGFAPLLLPLSLPLLLRAALAVMLAAVFVNAVVLGFFEEGPLGERLAAIGLLWRNGRNGSGRQWLAGAIIGAGAATVIVAGCWAVEIVSFHSSQAVENRWITFLLVPVALLVGAAGEELLFRGYGFQVLARGLGLLPALIPFSVLFGLAHLGNAGVTALGAVNTAAWGALFGFAYWRTGALWLPIGLHFGWNAALPLLGIRLSGFTMDVTGYAIQWQVGDLWSGGSYGLEGSLLTSIMVVALFFGIRRWFPPGAARDGRRQE